MIDILKDKVVPLEHAKKLLPGKPDRSTIYRWALGDGAHGVKLETVKVGRKRFTSEQAIQRFVDAMTAAAAGEPVTVIRTNRQRRHAIKTAAARLAKAGI
jgi:hypothetical protein